MIELRRKRLNIIGISVAIVLIVVLIFILGKYFFGKRAPILKSENVKYGAYTEKYNDIVTYPELKFDSVELTSFVNEKVEKYKEGLEGKGHIIEVQTELFYDTLAQIEIKLNKENKTLKSENIIYHTKNNKEIKFNDLFRRDKYLLKQLFPNDNIDKLNKEHLKLEKKAVIVDGFSVSLDKIRLFKPGNGIKSLFEGETLIPKKFNYDKSKKMVAFTYDDGPLNNNHDKIREIFNQYSIPATFYVIGELVERYPDKIRKAYLDGHTIANHTFTHPGLPGKNMTTIGAEKAIQEIEKTEDAIFKIIGVDTKTFRPPGGFMDEKTAALFDKESVMWTVDSQDWRNKHNTEVVYRNVREAIRENSIVLFHDLYESSVEATRRLVPELIAEGYQFVDIDTLLEHINED